MPSSVSLTAARRLSLFSFRLMTMTGKSSSCPPPYFLLVANSSYASRSIVYQSSHPVKSSNFLLYPLEARSRCSPSRMGA